MSVDAHSIIVHKCVVKVKRIKISNACNFPLEGAMQLKQAPLDFSFRVL